MSIKPQPKTDLQGLRKRVSLLNKLYLGQREERKCQLEESARLDEHLLKVQEAMATHATYEQDLQKQIEGITIPEHNLDEELRVPAELLQKMKAQATLITQQITNITQQNAKMAKENDDLRQREQLLKAQMQKTDALMGQLKLLQQQQAELLQKKMDELTFYKEEISKYQQLNEQPADATTDAKIQELITQNNAAQEIYSQMFARARELNNEYLRTRGRK